MKMLPQSPREFVQMFKSKVIGFVFRWWQNIRISDFERIRIWNIREWKLGEEWILFFIELFSELKICNNFYSAKDFRISCLSSSLNLPKKFPPTSILTFLVCAPPTLLFGLYLSGFEMLQYLSHIKCQTFSFWKVNFTNFFSSAIFVHYFCCCRKEGRRGLFFCSCCMYLNVKSLELYKFPTDNTCIPERWMMDKYEQKENKIL